MTLLGLSADFAMRRTSVMTLGMVLIFLGAQLNLIDTYVITPRFSNFISEHAAPYEDGTYRNDRSSHNSPYSPASYERNTSSGNGKSTLSMSGPQAHKTITPPRWICWPILFLGTVVFLHGLSMKQE